MSPRTAKQFEAVRAETRINIKKASLHLFSQNGFGKTKVEDIAAEAGISKGLIYNYFSSKEELLQEIIADALESGKKVLKKLNTLNVPAKEKLKFVIESTFTMMQEDFEYWRLMNSLSYQEDILQITLGSMENYREGMIKIMVQLFEEIGSINPLIKTYALGAILDGVFIQYLHNRKQYPIEPMKKYILKTYLN